MTNVIQDRWRKCRGVWWEIQGRKINFHAKDQKILYWESGCWAGPCSTEGIWKQGCGGKIVQIIQWTDQCPKERNSQLYPEHSKKTFCWRRIWVSFVLLTKYFECYLWAPGVFPGSIFPDPLKSVRSLALTTDIWAEARFSTFQLPDLGSSGVWSWPPPGRFPAKDAELRCSASPWQTEATVVSRHSNCCHSAVGSILNCPSWFLPLVNYLV